MFNRPERYLLHGLVLLVSVTLVSVVSIGNFEGILIFLPGTQPGQATEAEPVARCGLCHPQQVREWTGSMMAHSARSPSFNAMLAITTKYTLPRGYDTPEYCLRCHSPSGWLAGRSHELSVQALFGSDLDGVHCDFCHRSVDPLRPDSTVVVGGTVPGYGNGMYVVQQTALPVRGARGNLPEHCDPTEADPFYRTSEYCGVCHEVSNPYFSPTPSQTPPHLQVPMERTYSEWRESWFASQGHDGTCQACHMKRSPGFAAITPAATYRQDVASHAFSGGNTIGPAMVADYWAGIDRHAVREGIELSKKTLAEAVRLEVVAGRTGTHTQVIVRLTNLTGHKLPTGFPEGRRMWVSVTGFDRGGNIVAQSGSYDTLAGQLIRDAQLKLYEAQTGTSPALAQVLGLDPGPSFLGALNDTVYFDNRIPPRGFRNDSFRARRAEPVGAHYDDGQYWDTTSYTMPATVARVEARVYYQPISGEFALFMRDENVNNPYDWNNWGEKVYQIWQRLGGPVVMACAWTEVSSRAPRLPEFQDFDVPARFSLAQNYPNPFNARTAIEFTLSNTAHVVLSLFDVQGREITTFANGELSAGLHVRHLNATDLASGIYIYRMTVGAVTQTRKMIVLK